MSAGQRGIQAAHATAQYIIDYNPHQMGLWANGSIINLGLGSEKSLRKWIKKLSDLNIAHSIFREPDIGNQITSIAILRK